MYKRVLMLDVLLGSIIGALSVYVFATPIAIIFTATVAVVILLLEFDDFNLKEVKQ